jgi:GT2 family glycosyltransferase
MSSAKVSVCIPTHNGAEFVAKAIESVMAQSFMDFELLVVDDSSDDTTVDIVRSFTDPRLRIYQNEKRRGIPGNWNHCLSLARGEYICLFHQDDVMLPENLERKVEVLTSDVTISFVHSAAEVLVEDSAQSAFNNWIEDADQDFIAEGMTYFRKLLFHGNLICAPAVVARRQRLLDLGGFDEQLGYTPDYEMWMKACIEGCVGFLCQPLIVYRWHGKNASHAYRFERGVEETLLARRRAVQHYVERTGRREEGEIFEAATVALGGLGRWAAGLEQGKAWLEEQWVSWQRVAEEKEKMIQEQQAWIAELEKGKAWLEEQWTNWRQIAGEREKTIQEQRARIMELEEGKARLEEQ